MRKTLIRTMVVLAVFGVSQVLRAQVPPVPAPTATSPKLNLTLEQRYTIKEIVKDLKAEPAPSDVHVTLGEAAPQNVSLHPMPAEIAQKVPQVKSHKFFVTSEEIAIVDPKDNTIADVVKIRAD
jgi:Protein of unknown function (DUF1236)